MVSPDYGEHDVQRDRYTDDRDSIDKAHHNKELGAKHRQQFRLAGNTLKKAGTQNTNANANAYAGKAEQHCTGNVE